MSAITLTVMIALVLTYGARMVDVIREEEKALAEVRAVRLAEHLGTVPNSPEIEDVERAAELVKGARVNKVGVRIWDRTGVEFTQRLRTGDNLVSGDIPPQKAALLVRNQIARIEYGQVVETGASIYRVFAPINRKGKIVGAVEISDQIDNLPTILKRSLGAAIFLGLVAVGLITLATFILFRDLIYRPIDHLLSVIRRAKSGDLGLQVPESRSDEIGELLQEFNAMMRLLNEMTTEREEQKQVLRERVLEATSQLQQRNGQLEAANLELWRTTRRLTQLERLAAAGQTAAQFAHEVGTPLNLISCHAELIRKDLSSEPQSVRERTEIIIEQIERIERIVRRMLDRTRAENPELAPLDLNDLLSRIVEATQPLLAERRVNLETNFKSGLPRIAGDSDKLQQVFINLINNALDAMPDGGTLKISTNLETGADIGINSLVVKIVDDGCGMSPMVQAHIFDPLYTTKDRDKGTGLGLVVVNQVMKEHGGMITVESTEGGGSSFRLAFPGVTAPQTLTATII